MSDNADYANYLHPPKALRSRRLQAYLHAMYQNSFTITATLCLALTTLCWSGAPDSDWLLRDDGIGPVKVGMTLRQLNEVLGERFSMPKDKQEQGCFYVEPRRHSQVSFMILNGRLARIDIFHAGVFTSKHIGVGDSEARTLQVYGSGLKVEPHAYSAPQGHYLTMRSGRYGLRFETDNGQITAFYAGLWAAVHYIEGCQ